jgi:heptosyltransferase-1
VTDRAPLTALSFMRLLIVKLGSIGDIVHTLPSLAAIRHALPSAKISWVVERPVAEILRDNPLLDDLIEVDTKALRRWPVSGETLLAPRQQLRRLRASVFDAALDFQGLLKSASVARLSGAKRLYGYSRSALREPASRFLLTRTVKIPARSHVISRGLALASGALGISVPRDPREFVFPIGVGPSHQSEVDIALNGIGERYAVINPGGGWPTKLWAPERFGDLIDRLWAVHGLSSVVSYGPGESDLAQRVVSSSKSGRARTVKVSLKALYLIAKQAALYVGGDTGPTHLAVAAGAPIVGLFGPTDWWRNGSPRSDDICVERTDISCRGECNRRSCSEWICMDIDIGRVFSAATERLSRAARKDAGIDEVPGRKATA